jgi:hypothetical protein
VVAAAASTPSGGIFGALKAKIAEKQAADSNFLFKLFVEVRPRCFYTL